MILKVVDGVALADCEAIFKHFGRTIAMQTIRARLTVAGKDEETGRSLYDFTAAIEALEGVRSRRPHIRRRRTSI